MCVSIPVKASYLQNWYRQSPKSVPKGKKNDTSTSLKPYSNAGSGQVAQSDRHVHAELHSQPIASHSNLDKLSLRIYQQLGDYRAKRPLKVIVNPNNRISRISRIPLRTVRVPQIGDIGSKPAKYFRWTLLMYIHTLAFVDSI